MSPEWQWLINIIVMVVVAGVGILLSVIGFFVANHISSMDKKLDALPLVQTAIAELQVRMNYVTDKANELCERVEKVEISVNNTERVVSLERRMDQTEKELVYGRDHRHWVAGAIHGLALSTGIKIEPQP